MSLFATITIRRTLTLIIMLTTSMALLLASVAFVIFDQVAFRRSMARDLATTAQIVGLNCTAALSFNDDRSAEQTLLGLAAQPHITVACVYDASGAVFATYQRAGHVAAEWPATPDGVTGIAGDSLRLFQRISLAGERIGTIYVQSDLEEMHARLRRYAWLTGLVMVGAALVGWLVGMRLQRVISEPVSRLAAMAGRVTAERNYGLRVARTGHDELGRLIDGFNNMLAQIQTRDAELQTAHDEMEQRVADRTRELKSAQEDVARERARFKFIFDYLPVGIAWMIQGRLETRIVNTSHARITGVPAAQRHEMERYREATHPDDQAAQAELHQHLVAGDFDQYAMEKRFRRADGKWTWIALNVRVFRDAANDEAQEISTLVDVTERKEAETRLADSLSVLYATLESTVDGMYVEDRECRVTHFNRKFVEMLRLPENLALGESRDRGLAIVRQQLVDPEAFMATLRDLVVRPDAESFDVLRFKDGRIFERYSQPQRVDGAIVGRVWCMRDITERKRAEAELNLAHQRLVESSRAAGMAEVATGVLHNVGNVLNSVNVSAALLSDGIRRSEAAQLDRVCALLQQHEQDLAHFLAHDAKGRQVPAFLRTLATHLAEERRLLLVEIEALRKNVEHIKEIVAMQQAYAKVSGVVDAVPLVELIEDALRMNSGSLAQYRIELVRDFRVASTISVDRHKVLQILVNLIRNARFACEESDQAHKTLTIRTTGNDQRVQICVLDNGVGILAENLTRIFGHGFTTRKTGHGFGLHSGALAAKEMGGALTVYSEGPGRGATFTLDLPVQAAATSTENVLTEATP